MARFLTLGDIDAIYNALRPRLQDLVGSGSGGSGTVGPHQHSADQITFEPYTASGADIAAEECQTSQEELTDEKLARSGAQPMLGALDMNSFGISKIKNLAMNGGVGEAVLSLVRQITMTGIGLIENVLKVDFTGAGVGDGIIDQPRVMHMDGEAADSEGRIDGLEDVVFNAVPTAARIHNLGHARCQTGVTPGTDYTLTEGYMSWSDLEKTMVVVMVSGE